MSESDLTALTETVRRFNRYYTQHIGVLNENLLKSPFSLTEARVVYELAQREKTTATELGKSLGLDAGYLSRILRRFIKRGLIERQTSQSDARQSLIWLTGQGREAFAEINARSQDEIGAMLAGLRREDQNRLVASMQRIERLLDGQSQKRAGCRLRQHRPGDMGWVIQRHGVFYFEEYGWDERFEALVADIAAKFIQNYDSNRERCWIAEIDGEAAGSVFLVRQSESVAKLRLLLVEPWARGMGLGDRLVDECILFARQAGYRKITLWTNSVLLAARRIYAKKGFRLVSEAPHADFGVPLVGENWELSW